MVMGSGGGGRVEFEPVYHRYGPHRAGLPRLVPYFREVWRRRVFAVEMSKATMRGAHTSTFFGQAWLVLNPLLLAGVYYILVTIIRRQHDPAFFVHLTLGLFAFQLVSTSVTSGATSVTGAGKLFCVPCDFFDRCVVVEDAVGFVFSGDDACVRDGFGGFFCCVPGLFP